MSGWYEDVPVDIPEEEETESNMNKPQLTKFQQALLDLIEDFSQEEIGNDNPVEWDGVTFVSHCVTVWNVFTSDKNGKPDEPNALHWAIPIKTLQEKTEETYAHLKYLITHTNSRLNSEVNTHKNRLDGQVVRMDLIEKRLSAIESLPIGFIYKQEDKIG